MHYNFKVMVLRPSFLLEIPKLGQNTCFLSLYLIILCQQSRPTLTQSIRERRVGFKL